MRRAPTTADPSRRWLTFESGQLARMKKTCQEHCFSTLNHNLAHCYHDARAIKFVRTNLVKNRIKGSAKSFED
jgi:hypothetical protein